MPFIKKCEFRDATEFYGFAHQGIFACEPIRKGEEVYYCETEGCDYMSLEAIETLGKEAGKTRAETVVMLQNYSIDPEYKEFFKRYLYMGGGDMYDYPKHSDEKRLVCTCAYINHSCDPNCGFNALDTGLLVAKRDIQVGEEITYDYGFMETEPSFYNGMECLCRSERCKKILRFDSYRDIDWQYENYRYCNGYVKSRIDDLKRRWFSRRCYLRRDKSVITEEYKTGKLVLSTLMTVRKDELVAKFNQEGDVKESSHYIQHSETPNCYLAEDREVHALVDLAPDTDLTLDFNKL